MAHRATAGLRTVHKGAALLGEGRFARDADTDWTIESLGPLSIVGDIRLWNRHRLEALVGGVPTTRHLSDRGLLLAAYRRRGTDMMGAVDGDFAFVIWDEENRIVVAARDRFGVKPLFIERSPAWIRFASAPKQLLAYNGAPGEPSPEGVAQYLTGTFFKDTHTAIEGIERVLPAHVVVVTEQSLNETKYWNIRNADRVAIEGNDVPDAFREHLIVAVARRLGDSSKAVSQLSGGLDSSSIAASASVLTQSGRDPRRLITASVLFPGTDADESEWIDAITDMQPFEHVNIKHQPGDLKTYAEDMRRVGAPMAVAPRDVTVRTADVAARASADLVLTGSGGDDVVGDEWVLADILRSGGSRTWRRALGEIARDGGVFAAHRAARSLRLAAPASVKAPVRRLRGTPERTEATPITKELASVLTTLDADYPIPVVQSGIDALAEDVPTALSIRVLENQEAHFAGHGLEVSHPYLDRTLVEFIAGLDPSHRPVSSRNKTLVRAAFSDLLPESVLARRTKTHADTVVFAEYTRHTPSFAERFPTTTEPAKRYLDTDRYTTLLATARADRASFEDLKPLWRSWMFMLWLEGRNTDT